MLQQNLYNENNRYLSWLVKNYKYFFDLDIVIFILSILGYFVFYKNTMLLNICLFIMSLISISVAMLWRKRINTDQNKKPLVITPRVKRLIVTTSILFLIVIVFMFISKSIKT